MRRPDHAIGLSGQVAACFADSRAPDRVEHGLQTLLAQRVHGIALGYEDLNDHDELRAWAGVGQARSALVTVSVRRIKVAMASASPLETVFAQAHARLCQTAA